jgi:hypothetical protein
LKVEFVPGPTVDMWVYGDKRLLTGNGANPRGRKAPIQAFFDAVGISESQGAEIEVVETARGSLQIKRAV